MTDHLKCKWLADDEGNWHTSCGNIFVIIEGTPSENEMKFCCYCGGALRQGKRKRR